MNPTTSQDALAQLQQTQGSARSAADILGNQRQQLGVNAAQDTVSGLRGAITNTTKLLNQVAPSVMGRTANSLVTNAQATRQIANEQQPISQQLGQTTQDYNTALSDYDRTASRASEAANMEYGDQQNKLSYLQNLYNSLYGREQDAAKMAEEQRQFNEQLALSKAKANSGGGNYFDPTPTPPPSSPSAPTSPLQQAKYNDALTRLGRDSDADLVSDYKATLQSANYGNPGDQFKIKVYQQQRPDLFLPIGKQYARYFMSTQQNSAPQGSPKPVNLTAGLGSALTRGF
jgi:hypothetical protein